MPSDAKLIFYDFADIKRSIFFLNGFFENQAHHPYSFIISKKVPTLLDGLLTDQYWLSMLSGICLFKLETANESYFFCIDTVDRSIPVSNAGYGYHLPLLEEVRYYFKVNYNQKLIEQDSTTLKYRDKIIPVPIVFAIRPFKLLPLLPRMTPNTTIGWTIKDVKKRLVTLRNSLSLMSLEEMRTLRKVKKDFDVFFVMAYYHDEQYHEMNEVRWQIIREIRKNKNLSAVTGMASDRKLPGKYAEFASPRYTYGDYMMHQARAKVAIYTRGCHDCVSFKLGELLALGLPILGQPLKTNVEALYLNGEFKQQLAFESPQEIVERVVDLLENERELCELAHSNTQIFDSKFTPQAVTADILQHLGIVK